MENYTTKTIRIQKSKQRIELYETISEHHCSGI